MRSVYKYLAYAIAALVVIQAAMIAFAVFGLSKWIDDGNSLTAAKMESGESLGFTGEVGFMVHGMSGMMLIPLVALVFLLVSFFTKVPGAAKWAGLTFLAVVVQVALGMFGHGAPLLGMLHGANALVLLGLAWYAGRRLSKPEVMDAPAYQAPMATA